MILDKLEIKVRAENKDHIRNSIHTKAHKRSYLKHQIKVTGEDYNDAHKSINSKHTGYNNNSQIVPLAQGVVKTHRLLYINKI